MGRLIGWVLLSSGLLVLSAGVSLAYRDPAPVWYEDYNKGLKLARERGAPVILFFELREVKASHELWVRLQEDPDLTRVLGSFVRIRMYQPDLSVSRHVYHLQVYPALVVLDRYEREIGRLTFPQPDEQWTAELVAMCGAALEPVVESSPPRPGPKPRERRPSDPGIERLKALIYRKGVTAQTARPKSASAPNRSGRPSPSAARNIDVR